MTGYCYSLSKPARKLLYFDLAVDVWSAGIIMLCLLSGKYPFFRCADDMAALAQIMTVFGKERVVGCTKDLGKFYSCRFQALYRKTRRW